MVAFLRSFGNRRVRLLFALGFSSGLPLMLKGGTLSAWLMDAKVDLKTISLFTLVSLPMSVKFLWAPLLDRYTPIRCLGRRRGWMLITQLCVMGGLIALGVTGQVVDPQRMALLLLLTAVFSASQDIVVDAFRADILASTERGVGTSTHVVGYRVAMLVAGSGALSMSSVLTWPMVYTILGACMSIGVVATLLCREPEHVEPPRSLREAVVLPFVDFFQRPGAVVLLLFVMFFKFGDFLAGVLTTPFLKTLGFTNLEVGQYNNVLGFAATVVGALVGGGLSDRMGVRRALLTFGILQALANGGYMLLAWQGKSYLLLICAILIDQFCGGLATAAFSAFLIGLTRKACSATQYALLTSATTVAGRIFGATSGYIVAAQGWVVFYGVTIAVAAPALILLRLVRTEDEWKPETKPKVRSAEANGNA